MSEKIARALGAAASTETLTINGKPCEIRPVEIKHLTEIQRECLKQFRRSYLEGFKDTMDLLGETEEDLRAEREKVNRWDLQDLPMKMAYDPDGVVVTPALADWLHENVLDNPIQDEKKLKLIAAAAMDNGMLKEKEYAAMTGAAIKKGRLNYVSWWVTATIEGMVEMVYASFRNQGITKEDVYAELGSNFARLAELSREVEKVSKPKVDTPDPNPKAGTAG